MRLVNSMGKQIHLSDGPEWLFALKSMHWPSIKFYQNRNNTRIRYLTLDWQVTQRWQVDTWRICFFMWKVICDWREIYFQWVNISCQLKTGASLVAQSVKNPPAMQETACSAGDWGSIAGSGRCPGEGNGNPLQHSCLGSPMYRGAWWSLAHGVPRVRHNWVTKPPQGSDAR